MYKGEWVFMMRHNYNISKWFFFLVLFSRDYQPNHEWHSGALPRLTLHSALSSPVVRLPDASESASASATAVRVHADTAADPETGGTAPNLQVHYSTSPHQPAQSLVSLRAASHRSLETKTLSTLLTRLCLFHPTTFPHLSERVRGSTANIVACKSLI